VSEELYEIDGANMLLSKKGGTQPAEYELEGVKLRFENLVDVDTNSSEKLIHLSAKVLSSRRIDAQTSPPPPPPGVEEGGSIMYDCFERWKGCTNCDLCENRRQVVFGCGNDIAPKVLIIGEAPGKDEDVMGTPFIGKTGQVLRRNLVRVGINPDEDCFITNSVCCFPTPDGERIGKATAEQLVACRQRLNEQFGILTAAGTLKAILLGGKYAHVSFFQREQLENGYYGDHKAFGKFRISDVLGWYSGTLPWGPSPKVMTIYHPSYLERQNAGESSPVFVDWMRDLEALKAWALDGHYFDPRPVK
jgi:uracil-DNA glycosylase family 4